MSLRDPRPPLRGPRAAPLALDNSSPLRGGRGGKPQIKVASKPPLGGAEGGRHRRDLPPRKSLVHTSAYFRNRALGVPSAVSLRGRAAHWGTDSLSRKLTASR